MTVCPKCKAEGDYYYDGCFIECRVCGYREWAKVTDEKLEDMWGKWQKKTE